MNELKHNAKEVQSYLKALPEGRRQRLMKIVDAISTLYPDAQASMKYKMPTYTRGNNWVAAANQKNYISLYTCSAEHLVEFKLKYPKIKTGKGCINFKDSDDIVAADLHSVIRSAMQAHYP